jgi:2-polyprenyl-3-methyl-5-hydroxy-6-metoxy-1,4-benzoquinol methylase
MRHEPDDDKRVTALASGSRDLEQLKSKYEEIYSASDVWLYSKSHGVHSVILSLLEQGLASKRVLDVGCGAGRLPIMCALRGADVIGFDFSEAAIRIAKLNASCADAELRLEVADIDGFCAATTEAYDLITMVGVLEHVPDPVDTLRSLNRVVAPGGTLVTSCPNFLNLRGFSYMTLLTLLDLPLSLADVRQVDYLAMQEWAQSTGWSYDRAVGAIYRFGWGEKAATDMCKRLPLAVGDSPLDLEFDYAAYGEWLRRMTVPAGAMLEWLEAANVLKRITPPTPPRLTRRADIADELWNLMEQYMVEDVVSDPYYCEIPPFALMGGECIYVLTKRP